ncbi:MAG: DedA family protein [Cellulosilyticaceae bacterium]
MTIEVILAYLKENVQLIIFVIMFLEGLNLTGIPAIVILPSIGVLAAQGTLSITHVLASAILGSIAGNIFYYLVILAVGPKIYNKIYKQFKGMRKSLDLANQLAHKHGNKACCIGRVIPGARTVISLMAGTFKVRFVDFVIYSALGICVWNGVLLMAGYILG